MKRTRLVPLLVVVGIVAMANASRQVPRDVADAPAKLSATARIAPVGEPGQPLVVSGVVVDSDGRTPASGVVVYAYHPDANGFYRRVGQARDAGEEQPRLRGWARTDRSGHFEFTTIMPGHYPNRTSPAHVHIHVWGGREPRQWFMVEFKGDPLLSEQHFTDNTADYLCVVPTSRDSAGVTHAFVTLRLHRASNFPK